MCLWGSLVSALAEVAAWELELVGVSVSGLVANISIKTSNLIQSIERCMRFFNTSIDRFYLLKQRSSTDSRELQETVVACPQEQEPAKQCVKR